MERIFHFVVDRCEIIKMLPLILNHVLEQSDSIQIRVLVSVSNTFADHSKKCDEYVLSLLLIKLTEIELGYAQVQILQCL